MALLTFEYQSKDFPDFMKIASGLEVVTAQALGFVGKQSKKILKASLLSGQVLDYRAGESGDRWKDKKGRSKASYRITSGARSVVISSYPANFFTVINPRQRKRDIWGSLRSSTNSKLDTILKEYDRMYLEKTLKKLAVSPGSRQRF